MSPVTQSKVFTAARTQHALHAPTPPCHASERVSRAAVCQPARVQVLARAAAERNTATAADDRARSVGRSVRGNGARQQQVAVSGSSSSSSSSNFHVLSLSTGIICVRVRVCVIAGTGTTTRGHSLGEQQHINSTHNTLHTLRAQCIHFCEIKKKQKKAGKRAEK